MSDDLQIRCNKIYKDYLDVVCDQVQRYESLENDFPTGVLNEIRAIFTHFAKMNTVKSDSEKSKELENAERHMKRAKRDCYKYNCMAYEDNYKVFHNDFVKGAYSDECLIKIEEEHDKAINHLIIARSVETGVSNCGDDIKDKEFDNYEQAISHFEAMYNLIHPTK